MDNLKIVSLNMWVKLVNLHNLVDKFQALSPDNSTNIIHTTSYAHSFPQAFRVILRNTEVIHKAATNLWTTSCFMVLGIRKGTKGLNLS